MAKQSSSSNPPATSWEKVEKWYDSTVGEMGHYYHQNVILPKLLKLFQNSFTPDSSLLDLACGQGVLGRQIAAEIAYHGLDIAPSFIKSARQYDSSPKHNYSVADVTESLPIKNQIFSHATIILALQNIEVFQNVFKNAALHLKKDGKFIIVLNHPCYRIPRQSAWGIDASNKLQYRRINRYMSPLKIPLQANPSKGQASAHTWSFHQPLSVYSKGLKEAGFIIEEIEEWVSDKISTGHFAAMENRCREEFPLFLTIIAQKKA